MSEVYGWLARSRLYGPDSIHDEVVNWDTSGLEERFRMYKALLIGDMSLAKALLDKNAGAPNFTKYDVSTHPIFAEFRAQNPYYPNANPNGPDNHDKDADGRDGTQADDVERSDLGAPTEAASDENPTAAITQNEQETS